VSTRVAPMIDALTEVLGIGREVIKRVWPDPADQAKAELELARLAQRGDLKDLQVRLSAIVVEAQSQDPWTSRARPSFLYVIYLMILAAIPMGFLHAWSPAAAAAIAEGTRVWLAAIPAELWTLFGAGYLGYVNKRSDDKARLLGSDVKPGLLSRVLG